MPWAHHPHCDRHFNHLMWIRGRPLCLGCVCMYSGIAIGSVIALTTNWAQISFFAWLVLHTTLVMPTIFQIKLQNKRFKIFSRTLLGVSISTYFLSGVFFISPPFQRPIFVILLCLHFLAVYKSLSWLRNRYSQSPCENCPLGQYPTCEWNLPRLLAENPDFEQYLDHPIYPNT